MGEMTGDKPSTITKPMKNITIVLSIGAMSAGILCCGCSKHIAAGTGPASNVESNATAIAVPDDAVAMKIKWNPGKKYEMRMELQRDTETQLPDRPAPVGQEVNLTQNYNVTVLKELDDGGRQLQLAFEDETLDVTQRDRRVLSYNSMESAAQDATNPAAAMLRLLDGARLQLVTDAGGTVEKMEGLDELKERVATTGQPRQQMMFKQMFDEDTLERYCSFGDMMPDHPVKAGDSWSLKTDSFSPAGRVAIDLQYTFEGWVQQGNHNWAYIEQTGEVSPQNLSGANTPGVQVEKGTISSDIWFDPELGMIAGISSEQKITLKVMVRGQTIRPQMDQKIQLTLVDVQ